MIGLAGALSAALYIGCADKKDSKAIDTFSSYEE